MLFEEEPGVQNKDQFEQAIEMWFMVDMVPQMLTAIGVLGSQGKIDDNQNDLKKHE